MTTNTWRIWDKDDSVEQRTYKRVTGELPEMESTKQLVELVGEVYQPGMKILDVGCAAGHYYNGLRRIDDKLQYRGVDATVAYIEFAKRHFAGNPNTSFEVADIFNLPAGYANQYDIVFCCNVLLHLPSLETPLKNIITASKKYCFVRTLIGDKTHLSRLLYSDTYDEKGEPSDFVFQNTYSADFVQKTVQSFGAYQVEFIEDQFDPSFINEEFKNYNTVQSAVTQVQNGVQIAGSKVFEWKWLKVTK